jgi:hypothetical protein
MDLLRALADAWKWKGIEPVEIIDQNAFGNVIVRTVAGSFWRICPEIPDAELIAHSEARLKEVRNDPEFVLDWEMAPLVQKAGDLFGDPGCGRCYCLKIPAVLGGEYGDANLGTISIFELLSLSGNLAAQMDGLPDGSKVRLKVVK